MAKIVIKSEKTHILVDFSHKDVNFSLLIKTALSQLKSNNQ